MITIVIALLVALGMLGWGLYRALPTGQAGILAWLQAVVLMAPWLLFFGLFAVGVYVNLATILLLLLVCTGIYIGLGNRLRAIANSTPPLKPTPISNSSSPPSDASTPAPSSSPPALSPPSSSPLPPDDLQQIKGIFGIDTFFATEAIPYQEGAIFKGNLRGEVESTLDKLSANLEKVLGDRYRLFLLNGPDAKPVVVVLPRSADPKPSTLPQVILAIVLFVITLCTCLETAGVLMGFDLLTNSSRVREAVPLAIGIVAVLMAHEAGHWFLARRHQVRLSLPFFLPTWQIGAFGAITRFESVLRDRKVLFDVAFAGPAWGGAVSLVMLLLGLVLSQPDSIFQIPAVYFQGSILVATLSSVILGEAVQQSLVGIHPLVIVGWLGLVITAINLMPAGQLDGGRMVGAIYGRKIAGWMTIITLILLGVASLANPLALYWAVLILFLQRDPERPAQNELSEVDDTRASLGLFALFLMVAILLPLTPSLAGRLGIGGPL